MDNHDLAEIWAYHDGTKHSGESVYRSGHRLEWAIMPRPFKVYPDLEPIPLPQDFASSTRPALAALADRGTPSGDGPRLGRAALARLLYFSAGVLRRKTYAGGEIYFRAAACTGALYHIDLYLISGPLGDLEAGVYHFGPHDFALRRLRGGGHRGGADDRHRARDRRLHEHVLAQRVEVPGPHLPALLLGRRHAAREPARRGGRGGSARPRRARLRRRRAEPAPRPRHRARGDARPAGPRARRAAAPAGAARAAARPHDAAALPARGRLPGHPARARRLLAHDGEEGRRLARPAGTPAVLAARRPHRPARAERHDGRAGRDGDPPPRLDPHLHTRADLARPALDHPAGVDARHPGRLGGASRPLPHRKRGRRPRPGYLGPRPRRRAAGPAPRGRVPPRSRASGPRAGAPRRGGRLCLLAGRPEARARALWEPRLPRRPARGGDRGRQELPRRLRAPPGRDRPHLLRRRGDRLPLPARG